MPIINIIVQIIWAIHLHRLLDWESRKTLSRKCFLDKHLQFGFTSILRPLSLDRETNSMASGKLKRKTHNYTAAEEEEDEETHFKCKNEWNWQLMSVLWARFRACHGPRSGHFSVTPVWPLSAHQVVPFMATNVCEDRSRASREQHLSLSFLFFSKLFQSNKPDVETLATIEGHRWLIAKVASYRLWAPFFYGNYSEMKCSFCVQ